MQEEGGPQSRWKERLHGGPAAATLAQLEEGVGRLAEIADETQLPELARLRRVLALVRAHVDGDDAELVGRLAQDQLQAHLQQVLPVLQGQVASADQGGTPNLTQVNDLLDNVLDDLAFWPPLPLVRETTASQRAMAAVASDSEAILQGLRKSVDGVGEEVARVRTEGEQAQQARDTALKDLDAKMTQLEATINLQTARLDAALNQQSGNFDAAQETRRQQFDQLLSEFRENIAKTTTELQEGARTSSEAFEAFAQEHLDALSRYETRAEEVVGIIARTGMAGGYEDYANREGRRADVLRAITIGLGVVAVGALVWLAAVAAQGTLSATAAAAKVGLSAALGGLAAYTARESNRHRASENRARNLQLALASIGPYLSELDDVRRAAVIEAFSFLFFAPTEQAPTTEETGPSTAQVFLDFMTRMTAGK